MKFIKIKEILIAFDKIISIIGAGNKIEFLLMGNEELLIITKNFNVDNLIKLMSITEGDILDLSDVVQEIK
jgi:hypothetical protein